MGINENRALAISRAYAFDSWKDKFDLNVKERYETLHQDLLYTNEKQNFDEEINTFNLVDQIFQGIGE